MKRLLLIALFCTGAAAHAETWSIAPGSTLDFDTTFEGAPLHGHFGHFSGHITLDPQHPTACRFDVSIDTASADTGNPTGNAQLRTAAFFDVAAHPKATYRATQCRWNGNGPIEVLGTLTLRGVSKPVTLQADLRIAGGAATLDANAGIQRLDFGVGQGQWANATIIGTKVAVKTHLVLQH